MLSDKDIMFDKRCDNKPTYHFHIKVIVAVWAAVLVLMTFTGCHRKIYDGSDTSQQTRTELKKDIVFISAIMVRDTINGTYAMTEGKAELLPGRLKKTELLASEQPECDFTYEKRDKRGKVLSEHVMDNPFIVEIETVGEDGLLKRMVAQRNQASLFLRIQNVEGLAAIAIKNDQHVIGVIPLE